MLRPVRSTTASIKVSCTVLILLLSAGSVQPAAKAATAARTAKPPSINQILQSVLQAYGGADNVKRHHEEPMRSHGMISSTSGISSANNSYECDVLEKGNKVRVEMTMLGVPMIVGYDGKSSWTQSGDWICPSPQSTTVMMSDEMRHGLPALMDTLDLKSKLEALASQSVNGKLCHVMKVTNVEGQSTTFYVNPNTHLIERAEYAGIDHELGVKTVQTIDYADYRPCGSSIEPYKVVQYSGRKKKSETVIKEIQTDISIDDKAFEMPPESEIAGLHKGAVTIPFEYVGNEVQIAVRVNNGQELKFIVDTGASQSVIDKSAASTLGSNPVSTFSITAGAKAIPLSYTKVPALSLGEITLNNVPVLITDLSHVANHPAGLIGANILRRFAVTVDYDEKKLTLADPRSVSVPAGATIIPTFPVFGGTALIVAGELDGKVKMHFLVDTGASFSNLPQSLSKPLYKGNVLPVGSIFGLDGQEIKIGSLKLDSLKLGELTIPAPVFTLAPDDATNSSGLFTADAMGILGNPLWSQFKTTIDYRNERLILQAQPGRNEFNAINGKLEETDRQYLKDRNTDQAQKAFEQILQQAQQSKAAQALCIARIASCYGDKFTQTRDSKWLDTAGREFERAQRLSSEARNKAVEGQILAAWALMYLNSPRSVADITAAQDLLSRALQKAPMDGRIYAALGATLVRVGHRTEAQKILDRALVLDPGNWQALWCKYKLVSDRPKEQALIVSQLQHYYAGFPEVLALNGQGTTAVLADTKSVPKHPAKRAKKS